MDWVPALAHLIWLGSVAVASAQDPAGTTQAGGRIEQDCVWRGRVTVIQDVIISDACVRVEPGTEIAFAPGGSAPARIILQGRRATPTRLELRGTEQSPVRVTTARDRPPGSVVVPTVAVRSGLGPEARAMPHGSLIAAHTVFERLGGRRSTTKPDCPSRWRRAGATYSPRPGAPWTWQAMPAAVGTPLKPRAGNSATFL